MDQNANNQRFLERRAKLRFHCDYPAIVKGRDTLGKFFDEQARAINLSSGGVLVVTKCSIQNNVEVNVKIALPTGSLALGTSNLATTGVVVRNELQSDGKYGIAIKFLGYKFL